MQKDKEPIGRIRKIKFPGMNDTSNIIQLLGTDAEYAPLERTCIMGYVYYILLLLSYGCRILIYEKDIKQEYINDVGNSQTLTVTIPVGIIFYRPTNTIDIGFKLLAWLFKICVMIRHPYIFSKYKNCLIDVLSPELKMSLVRLSVQNRVDEQISCLYVDQEYRGRGIGSALIDQARLYFLTDRPGKGTFLSIEVPTYNTYCITSNKETAQFFKHLGWETRSSTIATDVHGMNFDITCFSKFKDDDVVIEYLH